MSELGVGKTFEKGSQLFWRGLLYFVLLAIFEAFAITLSAYFFAENSQILPSRLLHSLLSMVIMFISMGWVILTGARLLDWGDQKRFAPPEHLGWLLPTLLFSSILYSLSIFIGLFLLILPGLVALVIYSFVPYLAVFDVKAQKGHFKASFEFTKRALGATLFLSLMAVLAEIPGVFFQDYFSSMQFLILFISALFSNVVQILFLALFHSLCFATEVGQVLPATDSGS